MRKKNIFLLASFLLLLPFSTVFLACSKKGLDTSLHLVLMENPKSLDPIQGSDALAAEAVGPVYETLYQYHYLKRPYTVVPLLAEKMPDYSKDGLTVTIRIKKNVFFQDDPAFPNGKGRELHSSDFIYAFNRLLDPKNQSDGAWVLQGKVKSFETPDPYTLVFHLTKKYPQLNSVLAMCFTAPMAHEAIEKYGAEIVNHPVGTGAYVITSYTRNSEIVYERNPHFHGENFPDLENEFPAGLDYGKALPFADKIVLHIVRESQPRWLKFLAKEADLIRLSKDNFKSAIGPDGNLSAELAKREIHLSKNPSTTEWYIGFNMEDPVVGKNKLLRKAIGFAYDSRKDVQLFTNNISQVTNQILPSDIEGYDKSVPMREYNVEKAKKVLTEAGYSNGQGLSELRFEVEGSTDQRQLGEYFKNQMALIGIKVQVVANTRPELMDKKRKGKLQVHMDGWVADYPDAENFLQLLYGPNKPPGPNNSSYNNAEFNSLYEQMAGMAPSPARNEIIHRMTEIFLEDSPWIPNWKATLYYLNQPWLKNYVYSDFGYNNYKYYRLDLEEKRRRQ